MVVIDVFGKFFVNGYVMLVVVDVGVLNISDFIILDLFYGFFGWWWYVVDSCDLYGKVIELNEFDKVWICFGGDVDLSCGGKEV